MNKQVRNRDKKIAFLLIAAFAWLFIGSLIVFHQEHVLGKHVKLNSHLFISPKSKDKKDYTISLQNLLLKVSEIGTSAGIISYFDYNDPVRTSFEFLAKEFASFLINDALLAQVPLRAPPYSN
jgi:hypothetical protein